ncbi:MAG: sulfatase-like hydrolase/transferase, partial [Thermoproteota archaeon]|nr:sulfatase-like hydrolase/transferase [Thermoproteota archaeon]
MKPNIIFFLIDGLRADQAYGNNRTCKTPNIDSLIQNGMYFEQAISSVDGTIVSLNTIFNSNFQVGNSARNKKIVLNENNLIDILKKNGYHIYGTLPNFASFNPLLEHFENENNNDRIENSDQSKGDLIDPVLAQFLGQKTEGSYSEYERHKATLPTGLAKRIIQLLESKEKQEPYFCYFHILDLHPLREGRKPIGIEDFDNEKFGSSLFERTVSSIDFWLGKIFEHIDKNDVIILTSDHGERIPYGGMREVDFQPKLEHAVDFGKKILPKSAHKIGGKFLYDIRKSVGKRKLNKSNEKLTNYQKRSRDPYFTLSLFDELVRVPLLFVGNSIKPRIITNQVSHVDISPTIYELLDISLDRKISGKSLISFDDESSQEENPSYLHTMPHHKLSPSDMVGLRTSKHKYFRAARDPKENVNLYDLKNDPYENDNIAETNKELVIQLEKKILQLEKDNLSEY